MLLLRRVFSVGDAAIVGAEVAVAGTSVGAGTVVGAIVA